MKKMLQQILNKKIQNDLIKNELEKKEQEERAEAIKNAAPEITEGEYNLGEDDFVKYLEDFQKKQWEREDAIRKETQLREDNAYERSIESMRRAGVNPNLIGNISPAASGGGMTNATGIDWNPFSDKTDAEIAKYQKEMEAELQKSLQELEQAFQKGENTKDRTVDIIKSLFNTLTFGLFLKK